MAAFLCLLISGGILANDSKKTKIHPDNPVIQALMDRHSTKLFTDQTLDRRDLSNILWAAAGINRPTFDDDGNVNGGKLTIPTAMNMQHVRVFAVMKEGIFLYDPLANDLIPIMEGDYRSRTTGTYKGVDENGNEIWERQQSYVFPASLDLIFVSNLSANWPSTYSRDELIFTTAISVGCAAQDVYLYAASTKKIGATYRTSIDRVKWFEYLDLALGDPLNDYDNNGYADEMMIMGVMTIGYPAPVN